MFCVLRRQLAKLERYCPERAILLLIIFLPAFALLGSCFVLTGCSGTTDIDSFSRKTLFHYSTVDLSDFSDSFHHARFQYQEEIPPWDLYEPDQIVGIAENMIFLQNPDGGWAKNLDYQRVYTLKELEELHAANQAVSPVASELPSEPGASTLDNRNIYSQIRYLCSVSEELENIDREESERCLASAVSGLNWIINAQHPESGGFTGVDVFGITYNDDVMIGTLRLLREISNAEKPFSRIPEELRNKSAEAYHKGIECILKTQITVTLKDGTRLKTAWCQQHSHDAPFQPIWGRSFEPPAICSSESYKILRLLMEDPFPSVEMKEAICSGCAFFDREEVRIHGKRLEVTDTESAILNGRFYTTDQKLVDDPEAPDLWARFYALDSTFDVISGSPERIQGTYPAVLDPIWCDDGCVYRQSYNELSRERRNGYSYLNGNGDAILKMYSEWKYN